MAGRLDHGYKALSVLDPEPARRYPNSDVPAEHRRILDRRKMLQLGANPQGEVADGDGSADIMVPEQLLNVHKGLAVIGELQHCLDARVSWVPQLSEIWSVE